MNGFIHSLYIQNTFTIIYMSICHFMYVMSNFDKWIPWIMDLKASSIHLPPIHPRTTNGATPTAWWIWQSTCHRRSWKVSSCVCCGFAGCWEMVRKSDDDDGWYGGILGGMAQHFGIFWALRATELSDLFCFFTTMRLWMCPVAQVDGVIPPPAKIQSIKALRQIHDSWHCVWTLFLKICFL